MELGEEENLMELYQQSTRSLATANRLHVSIRVTKIWPGPLAWSTL